MKKNVRSKIWAMAVAGSVFFMSACNNSDYTKSLLKRKIPPSIMIQQ